MTKFCDGIVDTPAAWSLIVVCAVLIGVCIGAVPMWDVFQELLILGSATVVLMFILGERFYGFSAKNIMKTRRGTCKAVTSQLPPIPAFRRSVAPRAADKPTAEKPVADPAQYQESRQLSKRPVLPPTFTSTTFDDQADELSKQLLPTERCQNVVQEIAHDIKSIILKALPYADVVGFTNGEVSRGTAYGVAVPEVDIVVNLPPHILVRTVQAHVSKLSFSGKVDDRRLHKSAIRMCTDMLVTSGGFKFRRSAFRGRDPKVTLMAPRSLDDAGCIPVDFSVNAATPLCNSVLISAAGQVDPRARMLILLVKRWAKDRGICHAAKGHLMPYAWTLLCVYFLQVGVKGGSLLPPFKHLRLAPGQDTKEIAGLAQCMQGWQGPAPGSTLAKKRLGQLFKEFVNFYLNEVDWTQEVACIRTGLRASPHRSLKLHVIETPNGPAVGPTIEDPFMPSENMSEMLTATGLNRLSEELTRVQECFDSNAPLSEILTQWVPPETRLRADDDGSDNGEEADTKASAVTPTPTAVTSVPATRTSAKVSGVPLRNPLKRPAGLAATYVHQGSMAAAAKQRIVPPPGLWAANGRPPMAWPSPAPDGRSAA